MSKNSQPVHCVRSRRPFIHAVAIAFGFAASGGASAPTLAADEPQTWPEAETVRSLLRADAAAALADCRVPGLCHPGVDPAALQSPPGAPADNVRVAAIFGVARRLHVDLVVNGAVLRYQAGRAAPIGGVAGAHAYQLLGVDGACVRLRRDGRDHIACLGLGGAHP